MAACLKDASWLLNDSGLRINYFIFEQLTKYYKN